VTATRSLIDDYGLQPSQIIPSGEVVDLAESQGMDLHKSDGVHLNGDGSWMIGLAFSQMILDVYGEGKSIDDCTYLPENIQYQKEAKQIAHQALANVYDRFFKKDVVDNIHSTHTARSHEDVFYNLQGQRINKPSKGIYIVNGQKKIYR
jgi:uncharacterized protein YpiB (UPF0302 family)